MWDRGTRDKTNFWHSLGPAVRRKSFWHCEQAFTTTVRCYKIYQALDALYCRRLCVVIGLQPALTSSMPRRSTSLSCLVLSTSQYISTIIGELAFHGVRVEQRHQKRHTVPFAETPLLLCTREIPCCLTPVRTCLYLESRRPQRRLQTARRVLHTSLTIQETADRPNVILKAA
jgi:hypothetical protein